jgi:hypothetical protein
VVEKRAWPSKNRIAAAYGMGWIQGQSWKKWLSLRSMLQSSQGTKSVKIVGEIWKELDPMKRMRPTSTFSDHLLRSYSSLKMTCLKMK